MTLRTRIFIIISIIVIFVLAIVLMFWSKFTQKQNNQTGTTTTRSVNDTSAYNVIDASNFRNTNTTVQPVITSTVPKKFTPEQMNDQGLKQLAKVFVERYGTYSSDNNFLNLKEVKDLVTPGLWSSIKPTDSKRTGEFVGVTTEAFYAEIVKKSATDATINVQTIRNQTKNNKLSTLQQVAVVRMLKQGDAWLVDKVVWEK
jgi:hypothetical protein